MSDKAYGKMMVKAVTKAVGRAGPVRRVERFSSANDVARAARETGAARLVIVSHGSLDRPNLLPDRDDDRNQNGRPLRGTELGTVLRGTSIRDVVILGSDAAATGLASDVSTAVKGGVRVTAFEGSIGLYGRPRRKPTELEITTTDTVRREFVTQAPLPERDLDDGLDGSFLLPDR